MELSGIVRILSTFHPDVNFNTQEGLIKTHILTSLDIVSLVTELYNEYDIEIPVQEIIPENFESAKTIAALLTRLSDE